MARLPETLCALASKILGQVPVRLIDIEALSDFTDDPRVKAAISEAAINFKTGMKEDLHLSAECLLDAADYLREDYAPPEILDLQFHIQINL